MNTILTHNKVIDEVAEIINRCSKCGDEVVEVIDFADCGDEVVDVIDFADCGNMEISLIYARATCRCAGELVFEVIDYLQLIKS